MSNSTAILYFTRSGREEILKKRFHANKWRSYQIANHLIDRTRRVIEHSGLPVYEFGTTQQVGETPISRFNHAIQHLFEKGYDQVITVGNDCPTLTTNDIKEASKQLQTHSLVVGPDQKGGVFLLGISKEAYNAHLILNLPWGSHAFLQTLNRQYGSQNISYLETLPDLNDQVEIYRLRKITLRTALLRSFLQFFQELFNHNLSSSLQQARMIPAFDLRGPPLK